MKNIWNRTQVSMRHTNKWWIQLIEALFKLFHSADIYDNFKYHISLYELYLFKMQRTQSIKPIFYAYLASWFFCCYSRHCICCYIVNRTYYALQQGRWKYLFAILLVFGRPDLLLLLWEFWSLSIPDRTYERNLTDRSGSGT